MKALLLLGVLLATPLLAHADCYGSDSFQTCHDSRTGNHMTVQRYGGTTSMQGRNANTGARWDQTSTTIGDTTYHSGRAANGNRWHGTSTTYGNCVQHSGVDSYGRRYNRTVCN